MSSRRKGGLNFNEFCLHRTKQKIWAKSYFKFTRWCFLPNTKFYPNQMIHAEVENDFRFISYTADSINATHLAWIIMNITLNKRICFYLSIFLAQFHIKGINSRDGSICAARVKPKNSNIWSTYNQLHHGKIHRTENDCGSNEVGCRNDEAQVHTIQCLKGCVRNKSAIRHRQFRHFCSPPLPKHIQGRP